MQKLTNNLRKTTFCILLSLFAATAHAHITICPQINTIKRVNGTYIWNTSKLGWMGKFWAPQGSKGKSYHIKKFIYAEWIQSADIKNSAGYVNCFYLGDVDREVILFMQTKFSPQKPKNKYPWNCRNNIQEFPAVACSCELNIKKCRFTTE